MIQAKLQSFTVYESALMRTTSTVVDTPDAILLIDPTWLPEEIATIRRDIELKRHDRPLYVIFTHHHFDHIIGAYGFTDATTIASQAFVEADSSDQLKEIHEFYEEYYIDRPIQKPDIDIVIQPNQTLSLGSIPVTFISTPGHDATHMSVLIESMNLLICGDYGSNIEPPFIEHDPSDYLDTLQTLQSLVYEHEIRWFVPGHGDLCDNRSAMIQRLSAAEEYILALPHERHWSSSWPEHSFFDRVHERNREMVEQKETDRRSRQQDY